MLAEAAETKTNSYKIEDDRDLMRDSDGTKDGFKDPLYGKGTSKRIWGELYKVLDSSDVICEVLDARDPMGTRCLHVEKFLKREKPHKHVILILNKVDLVPTWITVRVRITSCGRKSV